MKYKDATVAEINEAMERSWQAFRTYRKLTLKQRADFLRQIAVELESVSSELIDTAGRETNLEEARLKVEFKRTLFQLTSYAEACEEGKWLEIRISPQLSSPV